MSRRWCDNDEFFMRKAQRARSSKRRANFSCNANDTISTLPAKCPVQEIMELESRSLREKGKIEFSKSTKGKIEFSFPKSRRACRKLERDTQTYGKAFEIFSGPKVEYKKFSTFEQFLNQSSGMTKRQKKAAQALKIAPEKKKKVVTPPQPEEVQVNKEVTINPVSGFKKMADLQTKRCCRNRKHGRSQAFARLDLQDALAASELGQPVFYGYFSQCYADADYDHSSPDDWRTDLEIFLSAPPPLLPDLSKTLAPQLCTEGDFLAPRLPTQSSGEPLVLRGQEFGLFSGTEEDEFDAHFENFEKYLAAEENEFDAHFENFEKYLAAEENEFDAHFENFANFEEFFSSSENDEAEEEPEFFFVDLFAEEEDSDCVLLELETEVLENEDGFCVLDLEE